MTRRKLRLLFDATALAGGLRSGFSRSGIFRAAYELLMALSAREDVEIGICSDRHHAAAVHAVLDKGRGGFWQDVRFWLEARHAPPKGERGRGLMPVFWFLYRASRWILLFIPRRICDWTSEWRYVSLRTDELREYDSYFSSYFAPPEEIRRCGIPRWTLFYDAIVGLYPAYYVPPEGDWWRELVRAMTPEDRAFAISESTRRDMLKAVPVLRPERVSVVPLAASSRFAPCTDCNLVESVRLKYGIPPGKRYFISMCTLEPRKNVPLAVRAFLRATEGRDDTVFVIAGGIWQSYRKEWASFLCELGAGQNRLVRAGYVEDADQPVLYSGATAFVYLSEYEGFGLPPLEAMQCGCPVLTSDTSSLPEVVGDCGMLVSLSDERSASEAMKRLLDDAALVQDLRRRGLERARQFSWKRSVDLILSGMREVVG